MTNRTTAGPGPRATLQEDNPMSQIRIGEAYTAQIQELIDQAQARAIARTITAADLITAVNEIDLFVFSKMTPEEMEITIDLGAREKHHPRGLSTHAKLTYRDGTYYLNEITRDKSTALGHLTIYEGSTLYGRQGDGCQAQIHQTQTGHKVNAALTIDALRQ